MLSPQNGQSALMLAGNSSHTDVVQLLLSSGAKIDMQNKVRHDINQVFASLRAHQCTTAW